MALLSQTRISELDTRFEYEPMLSPHPGKAGKEFTFLNKKFRVPVWISSMTGGTRQAKKINTYLARVCKEFGMGMGLGSCRILLDDRTYFDDFDMRPEIGDDRALFANLGISQIEQLLHSGKIQKAHHLVHLLRADGLIIHVNPLQEWVQPEGDRLKYSPVETIEKFLEKADYQVIVKEVGQGMGEESLKTLLNLPLSAIEFAAFGGTNFSNVELSRREDDDKNIYEPFSRIGVDAYRMVDIVNTVVEDNKNVQCRQIIISGGIKTYLDGFYLINTCNLPAIYGQASAFLSRATKDYESLHQFVEKQVEGLRMAEAYLRVRK